LAKREETRLPGPPREADSAAAVARALSELRGGRVVVLADDHRPDSEGALVTAGELADGDSVNFLIKEARGIVSLALSAARCDSLELFPMDRRGPVHADRNFTISIEARDGVTTGISAADRARTIRVASDPHATAAELVRPGHVFPLRAEPGGVLARPGRTEAAAELVTLAGLHPAAAICQVLRDDGTTARLHDLRELAFEHGLALVTVDQLLSCLAARTQISNSDGGNA
jgi:3,4-dihydroxy 2-butanone 4-phosphate synthase/GTP cyclohydrolase II